MALSRKIKKPEEVAEALREFYKQGEDGEYELDVVGFDDPKELKNALAKEREQRKQAEAEINKHKSALGEWEKLGVQTADIQNLLETKQKYETLSKKERADLEEATRALREKWDMEKNEADRQIKSVHAKQLEALTAELEGTKKEYETHVLRSMVTEAAAKGGVMQAELETAWLLSKNKVQLSGDRKKAILLDQDGDPSSKDLTDFFMTDFRNAHPTFFESSGTTGGGTPPGGARGPMNGSKVIPKGDMAARARYMEQIASGEMTVAP